MSNTLPGADVRGFYAALGIELPGWAQQEASVGASPTRTRTRAATGTHRAR